ncbi:Myb DNA-binding like [Fragilaria crotonensis]|nr:Myb DNA-binding like [Fragilaria crotonensis]
MSSAVSLVPTIKVATKKRRPTFRPASAGSRKKPLQEKHVTIQVEEKGASGPNAENEPPRHDEDIGNEAVREEAMEEQPKKSTEVATQRRLHRSNKIAVVATRNANELQVNDAKSKSKKEEETAPTQTSLAIFCTKYRAQKRPTDNNLPVPAPPPPPLDEDEEPAPAGPQVKIVDGEIVLQESSIMVPSARKTVQEVEEEYQHVVEEEGHTTIVGASYNSFVARRKPQHWAVEETKLFYNALRQVGADFVTMEAFYRNRTRKQLKKKYQIELVKNPRLIELALDPRNKLPVDLSIFNVDKDSIVVTKQPLVPRNSGRNPQAPVPTPAPAPPAEDTEAISSPQVEPTKTPQPSATRVAEPSHPDIFDGFDQMQDVDVEAFVLEQEMGIEKPPTAVIPLAPSVLPKAKSKRPKFRAGIRKGK